MNFLWITLSILVLIICVISVIDIFRRRLGPGRTAAWVAIVVILPLVGSVLYWTLRKPEPDEVQRIAAAERSRREQARRRPFDSTGMGS